MRIEGHYSFEAQRQLVWQVLRDPEVLQHAIAGLTQFDQLSMTEYTVSLRIHDGPLNGAYHGSVTLTNVELEAGYDLLFDGSGPQGSIWGEGRLNLVEQDEQTAIYYEGDIEMAGAIAEKSPRLLRTTANSLIRQFFESISRHLAIQTSVHMTESTLRTAVTRPSEATIPQDKGPDHSQDRQTYLIVVALMLVAVLSFTGSAFIVRALLAWGRRIIKGQDSADEGQDH